MAKNCKTCLNELIPLCAAQYGMSKECEAWQPKKVMEKPEVRAEVVKIQGGVDAGKFYVALLVNDKHFDTWGSTNELTEAEAKLIADRINTDPAEIEARVRRELAIKIKGLMIFSYTRYDEWGHDIGSESFDRDKVLAIIEGDSK